MGRAGTYTVRLTANGKTLTQPIVIKLDPRVKVTPDVEQIFTLTTRAENNARTAAAAYKDARALIEKLNAKGGQDAAVKQIEELAPDQHQARGGRGGGGGEFGAPEAAPAPSLATIGGLVVGSVMSMQAAELPPTAIELQAAAADQAAYTSVMAKWTALKAKSGAAPAKK